MNKRKYLKCNIDYRSVNDILDQLASSRVFSNIDLKISYHHIIIKSKDEHKTVFKM
jgi:hypothetical protein